MIYLFLSVLSSSLIYLVFKQAGRKNIQVEKLIMLNYLFASASAYVACLILEVPGLQGWSIAGHGVILGIIFVTIFRVMALTTQQYGVSTASVASKMSLVIPVLFALVMYNEPLSWQLAIGVILACAAVYLTSKKGGITTRWGWLPAVLFLGSGTIDTYLKWLQQRFFQAEINLYLACLIFLFAGIASWPVFQRRLLGPYSGQTWFYGILLGIVNLGSIAFLLFAFREIPNSSVVFPVNHTGIVLFSTLLGWMIFREKLSRVNLLGIVLAIASIVLLKV